jgi:hypothetical protein
MQPLDDDVVQRQEAVVEKARERDLMVGEVAERDAELGRGRLVLLAQSAPLRELVPDRLAARTPRGELGVVAEIVNLVLDLVEPLVRGERERGALVAGIKGWYKNPMVQHRNDYADPRLISGCVYCDSGLQETTRDHVPSKVLLDSPYPENLPVVPACGECNNGFSLDELYVACLIECVRCGTTDPTRVEREVVRRTLLEQPKVRERIESGREERDGEIRFFPEGERLLNVVMKLARGHAAFELSTPMRRKPDHVSWWVLPAMPEQDLEDFDAAHVHHLIGEVGSRASQRMLVVQAEIASAAGVGTTQPLLVSDWVDVQAGRYRYLAVHDAGRTFVKIVIGEYLACEVYWSWNSDE